MPKEGAAILSQVEGLLEQFLSLDYDTPVKDDIRGVLTTVRSGMSELRLSQDEGEEPPVPEGEAAPEEEPAPGPEEDGERDFKSARKAAMKESEDRGDFFGRRPRPPKKKRGASEEEGTDGEEEKRRKKGKAKAY